MKHTLLMCVAALMLAACGGEPLVGHSEVVLDEPPRAVVKIDTKEQCQVLRHTREVHAHD